MAAIISLVPSHLQCRSLERSRLPSMIHKPQVQRGFARVKCSGLSISASAQEMTYVTDRADQDSIGEFRKWLHAAQHTSKNSRGESCVQPVEVDDGLGLVALTDIRAGEEILQMPRDSWICLETVRNSAMGKELEGQRPWVQLALFLIAERANPVSKWRPYIDSLPQSLDSTLFWSDDELLELQGTQLLNTTLQFKEYIESEFSRVQEEVMAPNGAVFNEDVFTTEAFLWAFGILRSRTFSPLTGESLALVPLADLINHGKVDREDNPGWEVQKKGIGLFGGSQEMLVVRSASNFAKGEQILMEYGSGKGNAQLAQEYGFVDRGGASPGVLHSTSRDAFTLTLEIPESDRFFDDKADIAEISGMSVTSSFDLGTGQGPPENMLTFLRLIGVDGADSFLLEALFRDSAWEHISLPVSKENEEGICAAILEGCRSALSSYTTTVDEDVRLLEAGTGSKRMEIATVVRLGEKRVLQELQGWFEAHLSRLDTLEYYAERRLRDLGLLDEKGYMTPWVRQKCDVGLVELERSSDFAEFSWWRRNCVSYFMEMAFNGRFLL